MPRPIRFIAWLLAIANAGASGSAHRSEVYALKDRLLRRFGRRAGEDVQRIVDECWGGGQPFRQCCDRCGGTGIWRERKILLERWSLAGRIFHRPDRPVYGEAWTPTIEGRIRHDGVSRRASAEALLWLALLFDRRLFWHLLTTSKFCGWQRHPMLALQVVAFECRQWVLRFVPRRCSCGRPFIRPFARSYWLICQRCERAPLLAFGGDDDLPF